MNQSRKKFQTLSACFIPTLLAGYFIFGPQTQIFRSFAEYFTVRSKEIYLPEYLANWVTYYLAFGLIVGMALSSYEAVISFLEENDIDEPKAIVTLSCVSNIMSFFLLWTIHFFLYRFLEIL